MRLGYHGAIAEMSFTPQLLLSEIRGGQSYSQTRPTEVGLVVAVGLLIHCIVTCHSAVQPTGLMSIVRVSFELFRHDKAHETARFGDSVNSESAWEKSGKPCAVFAAFPV